MQRQEAEMTQPQEIEQTVEPKKWITLADIGKSLSNGRGPDCIWCNAPTQKTGSCYTCVACGETTGCG
jgi:hypothetical protein